MLTIYKYLVFFIRKMFCKLISIILSILIIRDKNIFLFSCSTNKKQDIFLHNTKYFYLHMNNFYRKQYKCIWLTDKPEMLRTFKKLGFIAYNRHSIEGIFYSLRAKYWFTDIYKRDITYNILSHNAICINFWHGIPLKKIAYDAEKVHPIKKYKKTVFNIWNIMRDAENFYIANGLYDKQIYESAFITSNNNIQILGSPRLDILFNNIPGATIFVDNCYDSIKEYLKKGKKIIIYMPTFRDTGKNISQWLQSDKLKDFLIKNNILLICKLHPLDRTLPNCTSNEYLYIMDKESDVYTILKYTDGLITDYSSIYFDYLLLDKPIIYYSIDIEEYQEKCRGFYAAYEDLTAGIKVYSEKEILYALSDVISGKDEYKEQRKQLRDKIFKYQDGKNCERIIEWIRAL